VKLEQAEQAGAKWAATMGDGSIAALRALPAQKILEGAAKSRFSVTVDGYFFPEAPEAIYAAGKQARVPLLAGWNSEEMTGLALLGRQPATPEAFEKAVRGLYGNRADEVLKAYSGATSDQVMQAATDLAGDRFIGYSTWKWIDVHAKTTSQPAYRYFYSRPRPAMVPVDGQAETTRPAPKGAVHSAEIEYAMGNLAGNKAYAWTPEDQKVSQVMQEYFANFVKTRNPNGAGLPEWPALNAGGTPRVMRIDVETKAEPEAHRERYLLLEAIAAKTNN
jgi:para-nitrobenzyl esterase